MFGNVRKIGEGNVACDHIPFFEIRNFVQKTVTMESVEVDRAVSLHVEPTIFFL